MNYIVTLLLMSLSLMAKMDVCKNAEKDVYTNIDLTMDAIQKEDIKSACNYINLSRKIYMKNADRCGFRDDDLEMIIPLLHRKIECNK
jgi:hypothetical protein